MIVSFCFVAKPQDGNDVLIMNLPTSFPAPDLRIARGIFAYLCCVYISMCISEEPTVVLQWCSRRNWTG